MEENKYQVWISVGQGGLSGEHTSQEEALECLLNIARASHQTHKFVYFIEDGMDAPTLVNLNKVSHVRVVQV